MKKCQLEARLTYQRHDVIQWHEVVERMDCAECDRHVELHMPMGTPLLFTKEHMRRLLAELCKNCCEGRESIIEAPSIDAKPVVRCKECKHRGTETCPMCFDFDEYDEDCGYEYRVIDRTEDDGHCHKGEKEEER